MISRLFNKLCDWFGDRRQLSLELAELKIAYWKATVKKVEVHVDAFCPSGMCFFIPKEVQDYAQTDVGSPQETKE